MSSKKLPTEKIANVAPFGLRMLTPLKERVQAAAAANNRSMNAEIVARLEASFNVADDAATLFEANKINRETQELLRKIDTYINRANRKLGE